MFRYIIYSSILFLSVIFVVTTIQSSSANADTGSYRVSHSSHSHLFDDHHDVHGDRVRGRSSLGRWWSGRSGMEKLLLIFVILLLATIMWHLITSKKTEIVYASPAPPPAAEAAEKKEELAPAAPSPATAKYDGPGMFEISLSVMGGVIIVLLVLILLALVPAS